ncbi:MAG: M56 family metallopeptidase [Ferruginibacter sp.]|nr:M56 family metallopeptidase [Chitinophagaceae bacterium]
MIPYIIKVALILAGCLVFYKLLPGRETFYRMNRYVLMLCLFISFSLPMLPVPQQWSLRKKETTAIESGTSIIPTATPEKNTTLSPPTVQKSTNEISLPPTDNRFSLEKVTNWLFYLYWFGVIVFSFNFLLQVILLLWRAYRNPVIVDGQYRIVEISGDKAPCSFGNTIFINPEKYEWDVYNQILLHEKVHIRQKHTLDILAAELMLIFQWFNPFAWRYRREIENNLEFLTDDQLMQQNKVERTSYQLSLVKVSAPHFPLSLTTNYNQSILKKRIAMMNTKKSNVHTAWKYFFLLPVLVLFACLLNEPRAISQSPNDTKNKEKAQHSNDLNKEGYWYAVIKDEKVNIRFSSDEDVDRSFDHSSGHSFQGTTFKLSELSNLPKGTSGTFTITREAGRMDFTGKFEGNTGMGTYKFTADQQYVAYMNGEVLDKLDEDEQMAFFFIDVKKAYLQMLKTEGFTSLDKDELIPLAALKVDGDFIKSIKDNGFKEVTAENLVTLKALGIDAAYIQEIRSTGLKKIDIDKLITFKAQGIDKDYITKVRSDRAKDPNNKESDEDFDEGDDIVTFKALGITEEFANSFKAVGYTNIPNEYLISMKALGITPEFIKSFHTAGYKDIELDDLSSLKALHITPEYIKGFEAIGFKNIPIDDLAGLKGVGVTPEYVTSMKAKGFNYDKLSKYITLKSMD